MLQPNGPSWTHVVRTLSTTAQWGCSRGPGAWRQPPKMWRSSGKAWLGGRALRRLLLNPREDPRGTPPELAASADITFSLSSLSCVSGTAGTGFLHAPCHNGSLAGRGVAYSGGPLSTNSSGEPGIAGEARLAGGPVPAVLADARHALWSSEPLLSVGPVQALASRAFVSSVPWASSGAGVSQLSGGTPISRGPSSTRVTNGARRAGGARGTSGTRPTDGARC